MADRESLDAITRLQNERVATLRSQGDFPATVYGHQMQSITLKVNEKSFVDVYKQVGQTTMLNLIIDKTKIVPVLIHQVHKNPLKGGYFNVEFYAVRLTEKIDAEIPIELVGEAPAVKTGGSLFVGLREVRVRCLPQYLVKSISVDVSSLANIDDGVLVQDLSIPDHVEILNPPDETVAKILPPEAEEVEEEKEEVAGEPEVISAKKDKEEDIDSQS
jgi:large subunit ribosomal protein L25